MNVLIIGCGRVGSRLAMTLQRQGHTVSVVDSDADSFHKLDGQFHGYTTVGVPIDDQVLRSAGIESCDALAAVTPDDNTNIMVGQMAQRLYRVPRVVARIVDPSREDVFSQFSLPTVCPTNLSVEAISQALQPEGEEEGRQLHLGCSTVAFSQIPVPKSWAGRWSSEVDQSEQEKLFALLHENGSVTLCGSQPEKLREGDRLIFSRLVD